MDQVALQITSLTIVYSTVYSGADQRKRQSCASLAFVRGIHRWPVNSPHKGPVTREMFPFDDVIMNLSSVGFCSNLPKATSGDQIAQDNNSQNELETYTFSFPIFQGPMS